MTDRQDQLILTDETLNTHFAEAYRSLRANISFSSVDQAVKTIVVTSASRAPRWRRWWGSITAAPAETVRVLTPYER